MRAHANSWSGNEEKIKCLLVITFLRCNTKDLDYSPNIRRTSLPMSGNTELTSLPMRRFVIHEIRLHVHLPPFCK